MRNYTIDMRDRNQLITIRAETVFLTEAVHSATTACVGQQYTFMDSDSKVVAMFPVEFVRFIVAGDCVRKVERINELELRPKE